MNDFILITLVFIAITLVESYDHADPKLRIINKSGNKRPLEVVPISAQTGEVVYEDESEFQSDQMEEGLNEQFHQQPHIPHIPYADSGFGELSKRYGYGYGGYGHSIFGDDFALFLVLLTIAGFFGLIISMLMPFAFIVSNGGVLPIGGLGGLGSLNGINGLGINQLGAGGLGGLGLGLGGLNGGLIGRKRRSEIYMNKNIIELLSSLNAALDKYRT